MNKKGVETRTILWLFYIVLVLIATYILFNFINDAVSGKGFSQRYFLNDLGLTIDTLPSANGNLEIKYKNLQDYNIRISNGELKTTEEISIYRYAQDKNTEFLGVFQLDANKILVINKDGNLVVINAKENEAK